MRLLFVSQTFSGQPGGLETYALELARHLAPRCEAFHVVAPGGWSNRDLDAWLPFPVHRVPVPRDAFPVAGARKMISVVRREHLDTVFHVQWMTAPATLAARRGGRPARVYTAAMGRELQLRPLKRAPLLQVAFDATRRRVLTRIDGVFPVSAYTAERVRDLGTPSDRVRVIPVGTDVDHFTPGDPAVVRSRHDLEGSRVILTAARLVPHKGIDTLVRAMPDVIARVPEAVLLVVGRGLELDRLRELSIDLRVDERVRFVGGVRPEEMPAYYAAADVFAMVPYEQYPAVDGFGTVFLEASACERPVVGSTSGGIPDAIRDGETGLLVPPQDAPATADAIARILEDPDRAAAWGRAGRELVQREFSWPIVAQRLIGAMGGEAPAG